MFATLFTKTSTGTTGTTTVILSSAETYAARRFSSEYWLVKYNNNATAPLTRIPAITDVMDLNVTMGVLGSLSPVTQTPVANPTPPGPPPPTSTNPNTSVTATLQPSGTTVFTGPKGKTFIDQYGLYMYIAVGVIGSLGLLIGVWYWRKHHPPAAPAAPVAPAPTAPAPTPSAPIPTAVPPPVPAAAA
jgi:hypothetical protein